MTAPLRRILSLEEGFAERVGQQVGDPAGGLLCDRPDADHPSIHVLQADGRSPHFLAGDFRGDQVFGEVQQGVPFVPCPFGNGLDIIESPGLRFPQGAVFELHRPSGRTDAHVGVPEAAHACPDDEGAQEKQRRPKTEDVQGLPGIRGTLACSLTLGSQA